jgi:hypothetical protein
VTASTLFVPVVPFYGQATCGLGRSDRGGRRRLIRFSYCSFRTVNRKHVCSVREGCAGLHAHAQSGGLVGSVSGELACPGDGLLIYHLR